MPRETRPPGRPRGTMALPMTTLDPYYKRDHHGIITGTARIMADTVPPRRSPKKEHGGWATRGDGRKLGLMPRAEMSMALEDNSAAAHACCAVSLPPLVTPAPPSKRKKGEAQ